MAQLAQQARELLTPPAHPDPIGDICRRLATGFAAIESAGVGVIAQFDGPGEVVIELNAVHGTALHNLGDQADKSSPYLRMGGIEPHHRLAMHGHGAAAIQSLLQPIGIAPHHLGIGRLHQPILKPGNHLQAPAVGRAGEAADRIEIGI